LPGVVELGPARHAVHVGVDRDAWQRAQLLVRERVGLLHQAGDLEIPIDPVELRDRAVVQHGPGLDQPLARRNPLRDLGWIVLLEQAHEASFGTSPAIVFHASIAVATPSSSMSTWVTIRTPVGTGTAPTPEAASRSSTSAVRSPTASVSTKTMFVTTRSTSVVGGGGARVRPRGPGGPGGVLAQPVAARVEGEQPRGGHDARLAPCAAVKDPDAPGLADLVRRSAEHRTDRRSKAL